MTAWIADLLWSALRIFGVRLHNWVFDPQRAAKRRMRLRERWWAYELKAAATADPLDDIRAEWWRITFNFEVSPEAARRRGDLDPAARQMEKDLAQRARDAAAWNGPASDRAEP